MKHWWEAPEWADKRAMEFGNPKLGPARRVALTTDPEMVRTKNGALKLRLVNRHPHESLRIFVGARQTARC
jgi:hypothetical protein